MTRVRQGGLTPMEVAFAEHYVATGDAPYAAEKAGYSSPGTLGPRLLSRERVVDRVRERSVERLRNEGVSVAVSALIDIARDETAPKMARVSAADKILKYSGVANDDESDDKPLSELTAAELGRRAERARLRLEAMERERAERAREIIDVVPEPADPAQKAQTDDDIFS